MTLLSSEQYRDVLKNVERAEKIPTVQHLLRKGVQTFFQRFNSYPEIAGVAPGKIGILGDQTQFSNGLSFSIASPMVTIVVGRKTEKKNYVVVSSADIGKPHKVTFQSLKKKAADSGCPEWINIVKGVLKMYPEGNIPGFEAVIESSVPLGVGLGSTSATEVAMFTFLEILVGTKLEPLDKALTCQKIEKDFLGRECGLVDRLTSVAAKDRHGMLIDCKTNDIEWVPFTNKEVIFIAIDSHLKDTLLGYEYQERTEYLAKACQILGIDNLRNCTEENLTELEIKVGELVESLEENPGDVWNAEKYGVVIKYAKFYVSELKRVEEAMVAWHNEDFQTFGQKMVESHNSLKEDFGFNNPLLNFFVETSLEAEGVLGSRMTGLGLTFGGTVITLIYKDKIAECFRYIAEKFTAYESQAVEDLKEKFKQEMEAEMKRQKEYTLSTMSSSAADYSGSESESSKGEGKSQKKGKKKKDQEAEKESEPINPCLEDPRTKAKLNNKGCENWAKAEKERKKEECLRRYEECLRQIELEEKKMKAGAGAGDGVKTTASGRIIEGGGEGEVDKDLVGESELLEVAEVEVVLKSPTFYILSPFAGARIMFVNKTDLLRSFFAVTVPHPKDLVQQALDVYRETYNSTPEVAGLAPGTVGLFGEFLEYYLGCPLMLALPMMTVTLGGRNDSVKFSIKTTSKEVEEPLITKSPVPSVGTFQKHPQTWVNLVNGAVTLFSGHVPGFDAVVHSSVPCALGMHSCSALQASIYTFLEGLTKTCTGDALEKANLCEHSEYYFTSEPETLMDKCSSVRYLPTFLCREGHVISIDCKRHKIRHHFLDHPSYVFLIAACKENSNDVTLKSLHDRLVLCQEATEILNKHTLADIEEKHLICLAKKGGSDEMIKRATYIMKEQRLTLKAIEAIENKDYQTLGMLMTESHYSLRDDFEISSPEIEKLMTLALNGDGVLGAKMIGKGLNSTVVILMKLEEVDNCIKRMRSEFHPKSSRPVFYVTKPSASAFVMDMNEEFPYIL